MNQIIKRIIMATTILLLVACQGPSPTDDQAQKLAEQFIKAVNDGDYKLAFTMVEPDFFGSRPEDKWIEYYEAIKKQMGPVISQKLSQHLTDNRLSGRFYMYQFSIKHENGFTKEMITMIEKINTNVPLKISGHKVDSSKLMKINEMY